MVAWRVEGEFLLAKFAILILLSCGSGCFLNSEATATREIPGSAYPRVHAQFKLNSNSLAFGDIPWPDDLYLDKTGHVYVDEKSSRLADGVFTRSLIRGLRELDGFGSMSPIYFYFDEPIDPQSMDDDCVFLVDLETGSPESLVKITSIDRHWYGPSKQLTIRPKARHPLRPGHKYAAVITTSLRADDQSFVGPAHDFAAIRDAKPSETTGLAAVAYKEYAPVISELVNKMYARQDEIAALAVFSVRDVDSDLTSARRVVRSATAALPSALKIYSSQTKLESEQGLDQVLGQSVSDPGKDSNGSVSHYDIGWMIHGTFSSPYFLSKNADGLGYFSVDKAGEVQPKMQGEVPFSLWLPKTAANQSLVKVPVVIFQHGLGGERSDAMSVANHLNAAGFAVFAIDAPLHGLRAGTEQIDTANNFAGVLPRDSFGDIRGSAIIDAYFGSERADRKLVDLDQDGVKEALHPYYWRDATRQGVVDLMSAVRLLQGQDWSNLKNPQDGSTLVTFSADQIGIVGIDLGGQMAALLASFEPSVTAVLMAFSGGDMVDYLAGSPEYESVFQELARAIGRDEYAGDESLFATYHPRFWPELGLWQTLVHEGDASSYVYNLLARKTSLLLTRIVDDEVVNNSNSEEFAAAFDVRTPFTDDELTEAFAFSRSANDAEPIWRTSYQFGAGTHDLLINREGTFNWEHPVYAPFRRRDGQTVSNPVKPALDQLVNFFRSLLPVSLSTTPSNN
jgi:pimeloyl-ACP methyl ester carboxylesterase